MQTTRPAEPADLESLLKEIESYPEGALILHEGDDFLPRVFGRQCTRLRQELKRSPAASVSQLAQRLDRDRTSVQKDVAFLEALGLVVRERIGRDVSVALVDRPILVRSRP